MLQNQPEKFFLNRKLRVDISHSQFIIKYTLASPYAFGKKGQIIGISISAIIITITNNGVPTFT